MTDTLLAVPPVGEADIASITQEVWSSFLQFELEPVPSDTAPVAGRRSTGMVNISGAWQGSVVLECAAAHAVAAAEAMFAADPESLSDDEVSDAFGELTNMVGGNIKSLLPSPSALGLPSVASGESYTVHVPGALRVSTVALACSAGLLHVSLWQARES